MSAERMNHCRPAALDEHKSAHTSTTNHATSEQLTFPPQDLRHAILLMQEALLRNLIQYTQLPIPARERLHEPPEVMRPFETENKLGLRLLLLLFDLDGPAIP